MLYRLMVEIAGRIGLCSLDLRDEKHDLEGEGHPDGDGEIK